MKNILKKIGVIGLAIAVLAPFIELPTVKAANTDCTDHTVLQYYFLDVANGGTKKDWQSYANTYSTFTKFYYTFPSDVANDPTKEIKILGVDINYLNDASARAKFAKNLETIINKKSTDVYEIKNNGVISNSQTAQDKNYTAILHGKWNSNSNRDNVTLSKLAGWIDSNDTEGSADKFKNITIQSKIGAVSSSGSVSVDISAMAFDGDDLRSLDAYSNGSDLTKYFQDLANKNSDNLYNTDSDGATWLALNINRTISDSKLKSYDFGYKCTGSNCTIDGSQKTTGYWIWKDYTKLDSNKDSNTGDYSETNEPDILSTDQIYWPVVLNVEYEVCPTSSNPDAEKWTLKYDLNTNDDTATNKPNSQTADVGTSIIVDAKKPSRDGYTFQSWNTEKDGSGKKYNPENEYKSDGTTETKILYAQWAKSGTTNNEKTGVVSYVIGFISVGVVAAGIYFVAKKKNLFKQI